MAGPTSIAAFFAQATPQQAHQDLPADEVSPGDKENNLPVSQGVVMQPLVESSRAGGCEVAGSKDPTPACQTGGDPKKRGRPNAAFSDAQTLALEQAFARCQSANSALKAELATQLGLTPSQVGRWFEKRRAKKRKTEGVVAAAPDADAISSAVAGTADGGGQPEVGGKLLLAGGGRDTDVEIVAPTAGSAVPEAGAVGGGKGSSAAPATIALASNAPSPAMPMVPSIGSAVGAAPDRRCNIGAGSAPTTQPTVTASTPLGTPAALPSPSSRAPMLHQLQSEVAQLQALLRHGSLSPLPQPHTTAPTVLDRSQVAAYVCGSTLPLSALCSALQGVYANVSGLTPDLLRNCVLDLATRKSYGPKEASTGVSDTFEDESAECLWVWELRDVKVLSKEQREVAKALKKRWAKVHERLSAVHNAIKALTATKGGKAAEARCVKALERLQKTAHGGPQEQSVTPAATPVDATPATQTPGGTAPAAHPPAAQGVVPEVGGSRTVPTQGGGTAAAKSACRADQEAEKESVRAAKEAERAEKERVRAEKEAERERARVEKERAKAEKEAARVEKEKEREVKKLGFGSAKTLDATRKTFMNFFTAKPAGAAKASVSSSTSASLASQRGDGGSGGGGGFADCFPPPNDEKFREAMRASSAARMDAYFAAPASGDALIEMGRAVLSGWKAAQRARRMSGLPPSWALRPGDGAEAAMLRAHERQYGEGVPVTAVRCWRRKFVWFQANSQRPPYYGSHTKRRCACGPRRVLAREEDVEYDVMSDEDWEEEPEGENLEEDDKEEEEVAVVPGGEVSDDDSFVVEDGYLSEDEGLPMEGDDMEGALEGEEVLGNQLAAACREGSGVALAQLEAALERARRSNRPLLVSRLRQGTCAAEVDGGWMLGDAAMLEALSMQLLSAHAAVVTPAPDAESCGNTAGVGELRSTPSARLEGDRELLALLVQFLHAHPHLRSLQKVHAAFMEEHKERKIVKKWLYDKIKAIATHTPEGWCVAADALAAAGVKAPVRAAGEKRIIDDSPCTPAERPAAATPHPAAGRLDRFLTAKTPAPTRQLSGMLATPASRLAKGSEAAASGSGGGASNAARCSEGPRPASMGAAARGGPATFPSNSRPQAGPPANCSAAAGTEPPLPRCTSAAVWEEVAGEIRDAGARGDPADDPRFALFGEQMLQTCAGALPAHVVTALVKGLASRSLPPRRRAAFARALANVAACLTAPPRGTAAPSQLPPTSAGTAREERRGWSAPRSAPAAASFAELCAEPRLLDALAAALRGSHEGLAKNMARLLSALTKAGQPKQPPAAAPGAPPPTPPAAGTAPAAVAAADALRLRVAGDADWLALLLDLLGQCGSSPAVAGYAAWTLQQLLYSPACRAALAAHDAQRLQLMRALLHGAVAEHKGVRKYCLGGLLLLLRDEPLAREYVEGDETRSTPATLVDALATLLRGAADMDSYCQQLLMEASYHALRLLSLFAMRGASTSTQPLVRQLQALSGGQGEGRAGVELQKLAAAALAAMDKERVDSAGAVLQQAGAADDAMQVG